MQEQDGYDVQTRFRYIPDLVRVRFGAEQNERRSIRPQILRE